VCAIEVTDGELKVGATVHISGKYTDFIQTMSSMQIEHQKVNRAGKEKVRQHHQVFWVQIQDD